MMRRRVFLLVMSWFLSGLAMAAEEFVRPYQFGVLNQRSIQLTAQYWNPILSYITRRTGIPLEMKMGKTAIDTTDMTVRGEFDFVYTNHLFTPDRVKLGYHVIARPDSPSIQSFIIVAEASNLIRLKDLSGKTMVFPSREAFVGYWVPMDALLKNGIYVKEVFGSNQEGAMAQLQAGTVDVAAVNGRVLESYSKRENFRYRVMWKSQPYLEMPIMVNPRVPRRHLEAIRNAMLQMLSDPEGRSILQASAAILKLKEPVGFIFADDTDYRDYRHFYRTTVVTAE